MSAELSIPCELPESVTKAGWTADSYGELKPGEHYLGAGGDVWRYPDDGKGGTMGLRLRPVSTILGPVDAETLYRASVLKTPVEAVFYATNASPPVKDYLTGGYFDQEKGCVMYTTPRNSYRYCKIIRPPTCRDSPSMSADL